MAGTNRRQQSRSSLRDESVQLYRSLPSDFEIMVVFTTASRFRRGATSDFGVVALALSGEENEAFL